MPNSHVYSAINAVTLALSHEGIGKDRRNEQQGFKFRGIDDVYNALAAELAKANLVIVPRMIERTCTERATKSGSVMYSIVVCGEFDFVSAVDGSTHVCRMYGEAMDSGDKATNKAMSAAYKYACLQTFCIPTEGDNDAEAKTPAETVKRKRPPTDEERAAQGIDTGGAPIGTDAAAQNVAASKLAAAKARPASFDMLGSFASMKKLIGEHNYYRILGLNGFEKSNQITNLDTGRAIYKQMAEFKKELDGVNESDAADFWAGRQQ